MIPRCAWPEEACGNDAGWRAQVKQVVNGKVAKLVVAGDRFAYDFAVEAVMGWQPL